MVCHVVKTAIREQSPAPATVIEGSDSVKRHYRENYYVLGEGVITLSSDPESPPDCYRPSTAESLRKFRFSRLGKKGKQLDVHLLEALADAMTVDVPNPDVTADPRPD